MGPDREAFVAYPNRRAMVVVVASLAPLVAAILASQLLHPAAPFGLRLFALLVLIALAIGIAVCLRLALQKRPVLIVDRHGFTWTRWSDRPIPWEAVERWQRKRYLFNDYLTIWLKDPSAHPGKPIQRLLGFGNRKLNFGHVTIATGMDRSFEEMMRAFSDFAPKPPLPEDPRLARRLLSARAREERRRAEGGS
ncbi:hypothetical protein SAMN02745194_01408 [Roseomonas rosea]|uniref:PH domain-containing protein n=1 Tax=Muricoccus roseus TaxID=198092 RepID=A0A1M6F5U2_9PROT|nr:hypothetical protein [Roseomonas rosea]SHI93065.1 hypothetical protein SAMN02745194_01408 [Roseomonas rosea]